MPPRRFEHLQSLPRAATTASSGKRPAPSNHYPHLHLPEFSASEDGTEIDHSGMTGGDCRARAAYAGISVSPRRNGFHRLDDLSMLRPRRLTQCSNGFGLCVEPAAGQSCLHGQATVRLPFHPSILPCLLQVSLFASKHRRRYPVPGVIQWRKCTNAIHSAGHADDSDCPSARPTLVVTFGR